jgi:hypothetical protein
MTDEPKTEALRAMYWREEILQVMFWIEGEGFGEAIDPSTLQRFLGVDAAVGLAYLDRLVDDGYLTRTGDNLYRLTDQGKFQGGRIFTNEFADLMGPTHGECGPSCWCHNSPDEADACAAERMAAVGS